MKISKCETSFIAKIINGKQKRFDGRMLQDGRQIQILFAKEHGACLVIMDNTRVFAKVTCEVTEPRSNMPSEGILHVNMDFSSLMTSDAKTRASDEVVESQRVLERCVRDSKCVSLEDLCISAGLKVFTLRVDVRPLNDDGNLIECASVAAISALAHFRRPHISGTGKDAKILSSDERSPVPLNIQHMPLAVNMALYDQGAHIVVDPTRLEEIASDGLYVIGMNAHQEMCFVHRKGSLLLQESTIERCEETAVKRSQELTQIIRKALDDDNYSRLTQAPVGFAYILQTSTILGACHQPVAGIDLKELTKHVPENGGMDIVTVEDEVTPDAKPRPPKTRSVAPSGAHQRARNILAQSVAFEGGPNQWGVDSEDTESSEEEEKVIPKEEANDGSSEEETVSLDVDQMDRKPSHTRGWYTSDPFS